MKVASPAPPRRCSARKGSRSRIFLISEVWLTNGGRRGAACGAHSTDPIASARPTGVWRQRLREHTMRRACSSSCPFWEPRMAWGTTNLIFAPSRGAWTRSRSIAARGPAASLAFFSGRRTLYPGCACKAIGFSTPQGTAARLAIGSVKIMPPVREIARSRCAPLHSGIIAPRRCRRSTDPLRPLAGRQPLQQRRQP